MPSTPSRLGRTVARSASRSAQAAVSAAGRLVTMPGTRPKRVVTTGRAAVVGGLAAGAAGFLARRRNAGASAPIADPVPAGPSSPPAQANDDLAASAAGIATAPPVIEGTAEPLGIDEDAEAEAAAAEAGGIGGPAPDYAGGEPDRGLGKAEGH